MMGLEKTKRTKRSAELTSNPKKLSWPMTSFGTERQELRKQKAPQRSFCDPRFNPFHWQELDVWLNRDDREKFLADLRRKGSMREVECRFRTRRGMVHTVVLSAEIIEINREPHILGFDIASAPSHI